EAAGQALDHAYGGREPGRARELVSFEVDHRSGELPDSRPEQADAAEELQVPRREPLHAELRAVALGRAGVANHATVRVGRVEIGEALLVLVVRVEDIAVQPDAATGEGRAEERLVVPDVLLVVRKGGEGREVHACAARVPAPLDGGADRVRVVRPVRDAELRQEGVVGLVEPDVEPESEAARALALLLLVAGAEGQVPFFEK